MSEEATTDRWATPQEVSALEQAFPARVRHLMPSREECETALAAMPDRGRKWIEFQRKWFHEGLPKTTRVELADGVDGPTAFGHLAAIQGSFEPKHEHKEAAVAYLASRWLKDVSYS